jgi:hypothetical protein
MNIDTACKILNIKDKYNVSEIKRAYKLESLKSHPDRGGKHGDFILIKEAYETLLSNCKKPRSSIFDEIDKNILKCYLLQVENNSLLRYPIIEKYINSPIQEYLSQYKIYELNPSLGRLLRKELFYLEEYDLYIPLWHSSLVFYGKITIHICPIMQDNVSIDDDNNLIVTIKNDAESICIDGIQIPIQRNCSRLFGKGIPRIKNNIYDVSDISDIILKL